MKTMRIVWVLFGAALSAASVARARTPFQELHGMTLPEELQATVRAPDFPAGASWLNTARPLTWTDLRGKVVVLDFWTFCCINCMHVIPDLKRLEKEFPKTLAVVGVHSAKFDAEKLTDNIRNAVLRYGVRHPVVNDKDFVLWGQYGIQAWPSFALIDPEGRVVGITSGEGVYDTLEPLIRGLVEHYGKEGKLDPKPLPLSPEKDQAVPSRLSFPGKVAVDVPTHTLVVSDSGHHRILLADLSGKIRAVIGSGKKGLRDGSFQTAEFSRPQGVFLDASRGTLYVADTENHAVRKIDLAAKTVTTLAGTGRQAREPIPGGPGGSTDLNSPWDLLRHGDKLYIAMAGAHQIWTLDLKTGETSVFAGSGREDLRDGPLKEACLAQPSGIATDGKNLYWVDSETSSLREAGFGPDARVRTLVGKGLFDFGDKDGPAPRALLQHPIGLAWHDGFLYIADTYNNRIRRYDPKTRTLSTLAGGSSGDKDGPSPQARFNEPCGLAFAGDRMFIADTDNQRLRTFDLSTGEVATLSLEAPGKNPRSAQAPSSEKAFGEDAVKLTPKTVSPSVDRLELEIHLPRGLGLNPQGPSRLVMVSDHSETARVDPSSMPLTGTRVDVPLSLHPGRARLALDLTLYYCSHGEKPLCFFKEMHFVLPLQVAEKGASSLSLPLDISK